MQVIDCDEWAAERTLLGYSTNQTARNLIGKMPMTGALDRMGGKDDWHHRVWWDTADIHVQ